MLLLKIVQDEISQHSHGHTGGHIADYDPSQPLESSLHNSCLHRDWHKIHQLGIDEELVQLVRQSGQGVEDLEPREQDDSVEHGDC